jgi:hypothetical protein
MESAVNGRIFDSVGGCSASHPWKNDLTGNHEQHSEYTLRLEVPSRKIVESWTRLVVVVDTRWKLMHMPI